MELMTIKHAADLLKVSVATVRKMLRRGELPSLRVGRQIRFVRADIERWIRLRVSPENATVVASRIRRRSPPFAHVSAS